MTERDCRRRERAREAAAAVAARHGIRSAAPTILADSNHTIVRLVPPLVAKVWTGAALPEAAEQDLAAAQHLMKRGAPMVPPSRLLPPGPYVEQGLQITFWEYCPHAGEVRAEDAGEALFRLHAGLADFTGPLLSFTGDLGRIEEVLNDAGELRALSQSDHAFVAERYVELRDAIPGDVVMRPIHGDPHLGNLLASNAGPRWIDFEGVCLGPVEWDLSSLPEAAVRGYGGAADQDLLALLRDLRSVGVAVWCWMDPDRDPVVREAGEYHLARLRGLRTTGHRGHRSG